MPTSSAPLLSAYYFLLFAGAGVTLPYLPQHFRSLGFSGAEMGLLASIGPLAMALVPPCWGYLADRTKRPDLLLTASAAGTAVGLAILAAARSVPFAAACLLLVGVFQSPQSMLIDTVALERERVGGGPYARLRLWGSVGFMAASFTFGLSYRGERSEVPAVVEAALACATAYLLVSLFVRGRIETQRPRFQDAVDLLKRADLRLLFAATALHWVAIAPYNLFFIVHAKTIGITPAIAGGGVALGVAAEVAVMLLFAAIDRRLALPRLLVLCFAASVVRWIVVGGTSNAVVLVAAQVLHALTFGAFFVAAVTYLSRAVAPELRATGQALFVAATFGLGGVVGFAVAGWAYDIVGGARLFSAAGALEVLPLALALRLPLPRLPLRGEGRIAQQ